MVPVETTWALSLVQRLDGDIQCVLVCQLIAVQQFLGCHTYYSIYGVEITVSPSAEYFTSFFEGLKDISSTNSLRLEGSTYTTRILPSFINCFSVTAESQQLSCRNIIAIIKVDPSGCQ